MPSFDRPLFAHKKRIEDITLTTSLLVSRSNETFDKEHRWFWNPGGLSWAIIVESAVTHTISYNNSEKRDKSTPTECSMQINDANK